MMWRDRTYTPDEIEKKIKFFRNGCHFKDEQYYGMLAQAYEICKTEVDVSWVTLRNLRTESDLRRVYHYHYCQ